MKIDKCERICAYCECAVPVFDDDTMLCKHHGIVEKAYACRKFSYDPLKRMPPRATSAPSLEYIDIDN